MISVVERGGNPTFCVGEELDVNKEFVRDASLRWEEATPFNRRRYENESTKLPRYNVVDE